MAERGFDYAAAVSPLTEATDPEAASKDNPDFGVVDSFISPVDEAGPSDQLASYLDTLAEDTRHQYERALFGDPADPASLENSCTRIASQAVQASIPRFQAIYQRLLNDYYTRLRTDPRMVAATTMWAECVESATSLLASTDSPMQLSRGNIQLAVRAEAAVRLGKSIRWLTAAEADQLDTTSLPGPAEITVDESGIGLLTYGPISRSDSITIEGARKREEEIYAQSEKCWAGGAGPEIIADLQADAMLQAEPLMAGESQS